MLEFCQCSCRLICMSSIWLPEVSHVLIQDSILGVDLGGFPPKSSMFDKYGVFFSSFCFNWMFSTTSRTHQSWIMHRLWAFWRRSALGVAVFHWYRRDCGWYFPWVLGKNHKNGNGGWSTSQFQSDNIWNLLIGPIVSRLFFWNCC